MGGMDVASLNDGVRRYDRKQNEGRKARKAFEKLKKQLARE